MVVLTPDPQIYWPTPNVVSGNGGTGPGTQISRPTQNLVSGNGGIGPGTQNILTLLKSGQW